MIFSTFGAGSFSVSAWFKKASFLIGTSGVSASSFFLFLAGEGEASSLRGKVNFAVMVGVKFSGLSVSVTSLCLPRLVVLTVHPIARSICVILDKDVIRI